MNKLRILMVALLVVSVVSSAPVAGDSTNSEQVLIVVTDEDRLTEVTTQINNSGTFHEKSTIEDTTYISASIPPSSSLYSMRGVHIAQEGTTQLPIGGSVASDETSATSGQRVPWGIKAIQAREAATGVSGESSVDVAVLDTGIDYDHEELSHAVKWGVDTTGTGTPEHGVAAADDNNGHGTHVAGTIAAADDENGVVGVAPKVDVYSVKVLQSSGRGTYSDLIQGINEALAGPDDVVGTEDDADVITMSLGGGADSPALQRAVGNARDKGAVVIASVGNKGDGNGNTDEVQYPAKYDAVIGVGATTEDVSPVFFSSEGPDVSIGAPGLAVDSTRNGGGITTKSGSSMAAPHVAGTAALVIAAESSPRPKRVEQRMLTTAEDVLPEGVDNKTGVGLVRAAGASGVGDASYPPFAVINNPREGETVNGNVTVRVSVTDTEDNPSDLDVRISVGDYVEEASYTGQTHVATLNTSKLPEDESVTLRVSVTDTDQNTFSTSLPVTVNNERDPEPSLQIQEVNLPQQVNVGETVNLELTVQNTGLATGQVNGRLYPSQEKQPVAFEGPIEPNSTRQFVIPFSYEEEGTYTVLVEFETLGNPLAREIRVRPDSPFQEPLDGVPASGVPRDLDGDGLYEDVNGDGDVQFIDAIALVRCSCDGLSDEQREALDFSEDGEIGREDAESHAETFREQYPSNVSSIPQDPDGDGLYEDVDGNGEVDFRDVQYFFERYEQSRWMNTYPEMLDFDEDGNLTQEDVIVLFEELFEQREQEQ